MILSPLKTNWGLQSFVPTRSSGGGGGAPPSPPPSFTPITSDLLYWLDPTDVSSFTLGAGNVVDSVTDANGSGLSMSQTTSSLKPVYTADIGDGRPGVFFDSTRSDFLKFPSYYTNVRAALLALYQSSDPAGANTYRPTLFGDTTNTNNWIGSQNGDAMIWTSAASVVRSNATWTKNGTVVNPTTEPHDIGQWQIIGIRNIGGFGAYVEAIHKSYTSSGRGWHGYQGHLCIWTTTPTEEEMTTMINDLKAVYGIS